MEIGQEVALVEHHSYHGTRASFGWKVSKISPAKKIITVAQPNQVPRRFNHHGEELDFGHWRLNENVAKVRELIERERRMAEAAAAIMAVRVVNCLPTYRSESMIGLIDELEKKLAIAKAKVEAI